MPTKTKIWADIQTIMQQDYAGYVDKKENNHPERYRITDKMSDEEFEEAIQNYLLDFDDGHLWFWSEKSQLPERGFTVRRFENVLYVTSSLQEKRLKKGDEILKIDGEGIEKVANLYEKRLEDKVPERQRWGSVLSRSKSLTVRRENEVFDLLLENYETVPTEPIYSFEKIDDKTTYLKLTDFMQEEPIRKLLQENKEALENTQNLIIDVRVNRGGNDSFYFPIMPYLFDKKTPLRDLFAEDEVMYTNFTERNCDLWIQELREYLEQDLEMDVAEEIKNEIKKAEKNRGKGFVKESEDLQYVISGRKSPEKVYVLTDCYCGSSGDTFVTNAKKSPKVTVVGRPTMGIIDYFNVTTVDYGDFHFMYSISKMNKKYFINQTGVLPDVYIRWTPDHLENDEDLSHVMKMIG